MWENPYDLHKIEAEKRHGKELPAGVSLETKRKNVDNITAAVKNAHKNTGCSGGLAEILAQVIVDNSKYNEYAMPVLMNNVCDYVVCIRAAKLVRDFDAIYDGLESDSQDFGDFDWDVERIKTRAKNRRILKFYNRFGNDERIAFLVIKSDLKIWVRQIWTFDSDYSKIKRQKKDLYYTEKPNLQYWKDSGWHMDYLNTKEQKMGIYGDCRDKGYVFDYEYTPETWGLDGVPRSSIGVYREISQLFWLVDCTLESLGIESMKE